MTLSLHKLLAIAEMKFQALLNKNLIIYPLFSIGVVVLMRFMFSSITGGKEIGNMGLSMALNMGLMFNISMTGMMVTSTSLAEEKEKSTLRTLMTSSVNSLEFFLGSIIPPLLVIIVINILVLPISGFDISLINIPLYLLITTIASITSCIIGMLVGIFAKNQMSAGTLAMPLLLLLTLVPTMSAFITPLEKISEFLFTGVISNMINTYASGETFSLSPLNLIVLIGEILLAIILFLFFYKTNGYETD